MKQKPTSSTIRNQRATFDYQITEEFTAGIVLTGAETKSLRMGRGSLRGAYITLKDGMPQLLNAQITPLQTNAQHLDETTQSRTRALLLKAKEINAIRQALDSGKSAVPLKLLTKGRYIKVVIGVGVGKKKYDKRNVIKQRDTDREARRAIKSAP